MGDLSFRCPTSTYSPTDVIVVSGHWCCVSAMKNVHLLYSLTKVKVQCIGLFDTSGSPPGVAGCSLHEMIVFS